MAREGAREGRLGPVEAVVLAAGAGRRFGGGKLASPFGGGLLIEGALGAAFAAPARSVTVAIGAEPAVAVAAETFASRIGERERLRLIEARDHDKGMAHSLAAAIAALPADAAAALVFLGDMPRIPHGLAARLIEAIGDGGGAAAPMFHGRRGHPVLFSAGLFENLLRLEGDAGARAVLTALGPKLRLVEVDDAGVLFDVDVRN